MPQLIKEFDLWRPGYGSAVVSIFVAGTSTLATVYLDEGMTLPADNPQTLEAMEAEGGVRYGKFAAPLYTAQSYYLDIQGIDNTGIVRPPLTDLDGEDASNATVIPTGSSYASNLEDLFARQVNVSNYGVFVAGGGGVAATNTATMELAIAALSSGGFVNVPAGLYKINAIDVPENIIIRGQGIGATTLQSVLGAESFTIVGDNAGFKDITLDGSTLSTSSIGVLSEGHHGVVFENVKVMRFETGLDIKGGKDFSWLNLHIENVETAAKLHGDTDVFQDCTWRGGIVDTATTLGVSMSYEDEICQNIQFIGVGFQNCTDNSFYINGAQNIRFIGCYWYNNTKIGKILDDTDVLTPVTAFTNDAMLINFTGGRMDAGILEVTGTAQNVRLVDMYLKNMTLTMSTPLSNYLILENCYEDTVTLSGETTKLLRATTMLDGASFGVTTDATVTKAWAIALAPGQEVYLRGMVIAKGRNVEERAIYDIAAGAYRPGSTLAYDTQTSNFTNGAILTGASSGATARIQTHTDGGATGTLTLTDIKGAFLDNEIITDSNGTPGSALVNGALVSQNASLDTVGVTAMRTAYETDVAYACVFAANGTEIELRVTGKAAHTVEWTAHVEVKST